MKRSWLIYLKNLGEMVKTTPLFLKDLFSSMDSAKPTSFPWISLHYLVISLVKENEAQQSF
jgi:hypothetical protein